MQVFNIIKKSDSSMDRIKRLGLRFSQAQNETIEKPKQRFIHIKKHHTPDEPFK